MWLLQVLYLLIFGFILQAEDQASSVCVTPNLEVSVISHTQSKVPLLLALVGASYENKLNDVAALLKNAFEFTREVEVTIQSQELPTKKNDVLKIDNQGFMRVIYLLCNTTHSTFEWRLYDPADPEMLAGKSINTVGKDYRLIAYQIADALWPELTGCPGFFSTQIAYSVKKSDQKGRHISHIYVCDYDGTNSRCVIDRPTLNIAPRWSTAGASPKLYYSRCTASNMQLIELSGSGSQRVVLNADGLNMLPSFSPSGNGVAFNQSGNIIVKRKDERSGKVVYRTITQNDGNHVSPNLLDNGDVIFCSDFGTKNPQIYYYTTTTGDTESLTTGGYCTCPYYNEKMGLLVYTKLVSGVSQIFSYDMKKKKHTQLTFDAGHKDEPCVSPCGNLVLFSHEKGKESRIVMMHMISKHRSFITPSDVQASYASWSPLFSVWPGFIR